MEIERKVTLGEIFAAIAYITSSLAAYVFAYAFLVGDVEQTKTGVHTNAQAIAAEVAERRREDERLIRHFESRAGEIKEEIKLAEVRNRFLLEDIRESVNTLVRDRLDDDD